jgi:hypothetical protein
MLALLQRRDDTGLQAPFGYLQVTVEAIDEVDQQALLLQLALADRSAQGNATEAVENGELPVTTGIGGAKLGLIGAQGVIKQSADSFHPDHSLRGGI